MTELINGLRALDLLDAAVKREGEDFRYTKPDEAPQWVQEQIAETARGWGWVETEDAALELATSDHWWHTSTCLYFHDNQPGCVMGNIAVNEFGFDPTTTDPECYEGMDITVAIVDLFPDAKVTDLAVRIFKTAQMQQDAGSTWGDVVKRCREEFERLAWEEVNAS